jgi:hypothetical protein
MRVKAEGRAEFFPTRNCFSILALKFNFTQQQKVLLVACWWGMVFKSKLLVGERAGAGGGMRVCQLLSNVLCTDISCLCGSTFSVVTEALLHLRWPAVVKFILTPRYKPFGGPGFDPEPSECAQFPPNHFELSLCDSSFSYLYIHITVYRHRFLFNNQSDALINQIYSVIKLYMFRATFLPIIRSSLLYIRHW